MGEEQPLLPEQAPGLLTEHVEQPWLLDEQHFPVREDLVEQIKARSFCENGKKKFTHSGKIVLRQMHEDEELCEAICACILVGTHTKLIARKFNISPKSIARIREAMQDRGELAPVRLRVMRKLDQFIELGLEEMVDGVLSGKIPPGQLPIPVMCAIDKKGLLEAQATPGAAVKEDGISPEAIKRAWEALERQRAMKRAIVTDVQSSVSPVVSKELPKLEQLDTSLDTTKAGPAGPDQAAAGLEVSGGTGGQAAERGGGGRAAGAGPDLANGS